ncbi:hypothetical protein MSG28_005163 [Choristoneura fumiferana]|uniref:Uncharacterized protein n=1 Tax=Choristoneura fumiferana TaxID=7141 RepID=A0ACC0JQ66_CHOFU|nr:hypothetical protein MSG28_005163 [Choristoneura fumiferana]
MEAAGTDAGAENHLQNVLSETEIASLPAVITDKINTYIDKKFEEYLTSKALHETSKTQIGDKISELEAAITELTAKHEEAAKKLLVADESVAELEKQVASLNADQEKARDKMARLENEAISLKSARDAAVDERNDLTRILQRRDTEIERLTANEVSLSQQLRAAIDAKCEALALNDEIQSKELSLQYREKRIEQERTLLNSQIAGLTEEVNRLTSELQTVRLNSTSRLVNVETQLAEKNEELNAANETINQLNEVKKNLNSRAENLTQRMMEQREIENKMTENYKKELDAKTKLADLFKTMHDDAEAKTMELTEGISELQKLLNEATEKYGELETKYKQAELDHEEMMEKKNEIIASLKNEIEHANDLLKAANAQNLDMALSDLAPSAATASKLLKSGMSLTQIYSQLVKVSDELAQEKEENRRLNITINTIVQELEEKAPMLQKQKIEHEEAIESNTALSQQIDSLVIECNRLRDDYNESSKIANHYSRENTRLKGELADLGRQVCFLLKEIEHSRGGLMPNGDHDSSNTASNATNSSDHSSSRIISKTLVTFSDIQELQANNQKLLRMVRDLTDKQEEFERNKEQFESGEMQNKIESLKNRVLELTEAQDRQTKMVNGLIRQRDMFKKLYHDLMKGKRHEISSVLEDIEMEKGDSFTVESAEKPSKPTAAPEAYEIKYRETVKHLELLKEEYKTYKEEKVTNEKMLFEQIDNMRQEISKLTAANSKCASTSEYNNERLKILQTNVTTYKKQIASLEEKNKAYNATIAKHEVSLQHLRDEALNAQGKLAAAEIQLENLKLESKLLKDTELRLQTEKEILNRERQGQSLLLKNLELIKASLERVEVETRARIESRLDEATRECAALRRRLQEEQDRFRELAAHLERQTETAKSRMQEEKDAADQLRKEMTQLRQDIIDKNKANEELAKKLKAALAPNSDGSFDSLKKIKELENKLSDREGDIKSLQEQLNIAKEHIKQYCDISESAEKELKTLHSEYETYKSETETKLSEYAQKLQHLEEKCAELEAELSLQATGEQSNNNNALRRELAEAKEELKSAIANYDNSQSEVQSLRAELTKLSEAVNKAEEKYNHEMMLHSSDIQALSQVKEELLRAQNQINELVALKNNAIDQMESEKIAWTEREKILNDENAQLMERFKDLNEQNSLLHNQIQALGTQLSVTHASRSMSESMNESATDTSMNVSVSEEDGKSSEQLFQIVKFIRKEKDIAMAKSDILQTENMRLKSQLEIAEKQLDSAKLTLAAERESSEVNMVTINKQSDILRKVETLNALTDSNRILREERDTLTTRVEELTNSTRLLEEKLLPLQEKINDITSKNETLQSDNTSLKADSARWRTRVNALVERANKTSPEDWKRLQNERETLAKMLTNEKENTRKVNDELGTLKVEKSKLEEQYTLLSRQQNALIEENKKLNDELNTLKDDMARVTEELTKVKAELATAVETNSKLTEEVTSKDASLNDIRNKEMQIRKIAKKYKSQYEELIKTVEEEKKKTEGEVAVAAASAESAKQLESQLAEIQAQLNAEKATNETLKQELESLRTANTDKEEKAKVVLKQAKNKIVQLTELKNSLSRELEESRSKISTIEQSNRDEQDVRLAAIKSQFEGRVSRLEKERGEVQAEKTREIEALQQKVTMLQRQLASQSSVSKQQATTEKTTTDPPTANIKPMAGVAQPSAHAMSRARGGETPLASIRPMAQAVALVMPRIEQPSGASSGAAVSGSSAAASVTSVAAPAAPAVSAQGATSGAPTSVANAQPSGGVSTSHAPPGVSTSHAPPGVSTSHAPPGVSTSHAPPGVSTSHAPPGVSTSQTPPGVSTSQPPAGVSTSHAPPDARPPKRRLQSRPVTAKRTRVQGFERSVEVEYQVPTSSRCDQDDEGEGEEDEEDMEEEQEVEGGEEEEEESPAQSPEAGEEGELGESGEGGGEADSEPAPAIQQIEAISSGTERAGVGAGAAGARFTFAEAGAASHHDTHADLAAALPPAAHPHPTISDSRSEGSENREWEESRVDEEAAAVSSQGSEPSSPHQEEIFIVVFLVQRAHGRRGGGDNIVDKEKQRVLRPKIGLVYDSDQEKNRLWKDL